MKKVLYTLAALLTTTALVSANPVSEVVSEATPAPVAADPMMPAEHHHHKHKKMSKDEMKKACEDHVAKAKTVAGSIQDPKHKIMADLIVGHAENVVKAYDSFSDEDGKLLMMLEKMCSWSCKEVEKVAKDDKKHQEAEKKKAEKEAKKAEKDAKKAEHKAEEHKDEMKKEEPKKDEAKPEEKKEEAKKDEAKPEEKK